MHIGYSLIVQDWAARIKGEDAIISSKDQGPGYTIVILLYCRCALEQGENILGERMNKECLVRVNFDFLLGNCQSSVTLHYLLAECQDLKKKKATEGLQSLRLTATHALNLKEDNFQTSF